VKQNKILIIIINYNTDNDVARLLNSLIMQKNITEQIAIVVDNSSNLNIQGQLNAIPSNMKVLIFSPAKNLGYFGGAAWGLEEYLKDHSAPEWVILSNPDIDIHDQEFFKKLSEYYQVDFPAVIAPDIQLVSNRFSHSSSVHQNPHMLKRPPRQKIAFYQKIYKYYPLYSLYVKISGICHFILNQIVRENVKSNVPKQIYAPFGAFIIFHRSFFESGGCLKYGGFLFAEEIFVAEQLRELGLKAVFDNRFKLIHHEHSSIFLKTNRKRNEYLQESLQYILNRFFIGNKY